MVYWLLWVVDNMNEKQMKQIKPCFGNSKMFFKSKIKECISCGFKQKCLVKIWKKKLLKNSKKGLNSK